jgi:drug/metabolite transporter (DMT)-like permease
MYAIFLCHYYLSVSILQTINTVGPILVFVWDYYLYGIGINRRQFTGVIMGILGLLITINALKIYKIFVP